MRSIVVDRANRVSRFPVQRQLSRPVSGAGMRSGGELCTGPHGPAHRRCVMTDAPQLLLAHHLKALKLARQCATEDVDHSRDLLRLAELELIERERRMVERRIKPGSRQSKTSTASTSWPCRHSTRPWCWSKHHNSPRFWGWQFSVTLLGPSHPDFRDGRGRGKNEKDDGAASPD